MKEYHISNKPNGAWLGTCSIEEIAEAVAAGRFNKVCVATEADDRRYLVVRQTGTAKWVSIADLLENPSAPWTTRPTTSPAPSAPTTSATAPTVPTVESAAVAHRSQERSLTYFLLEGEQLKGPLTLGQLRSMWSRGEINIKTLYRQEGIEHWMPLGSIQDLLEPSPQANPPSPGFQAHSQALASNVVSTEKPPSVRTGVNLLWIRLGLGIVFGLFMLSAESKVDGGVEMGLVLLGFLCIVAINWFFLTKIASGRNWARILILVLTIGGALMTLLGIGMDGPTRVFNLLGLGFEIPAMFFLFNAESSAWFKSKSRA